MWTPFIDQFVYTFQFDDIGSHGTKVLIYNLWLNDEGIYELSFDDDVEVCCIFLSLLYKLYSFVSLFWKCILSCSLLLEDILRYIMVLVFVEITRFEYEKYVPKQK